MAYEVVSVSLPDEVVDAAVAIIREELDKAKVTYEIKIEPSHDPEDPFEDAIVIWAYLRSEVKIDQRMVLGPAIDKRLADAGLSEEDIPLTWALAPAWSKR